MPRGVRVRVPPRPPIFKKQGNRCYPKIKKPPYLVVFLLPGYNGPWPVGSYFLHRLPCFYQLQKLLCIRQNSSVIKSMVVMSWLLFSNVLVDIREIMPSHDRVKLAPKVITALSGLSIAGMSLSVSRANGKKCVLLERFPQTFPASPQGDFHRFQ